MSSFKYPVPALSTNRRDLDKVSIAISALLFLSIGTGVYLHFSKQRIVKMTDYQIASYGERLDLHRHPILTSKPVNFVQYVSTESSRTIQSALYYQYLMERDKSLDFSLNLVVDPSSSGLIRHLREAGVTKIPVLYDGTHSFTLATHMPSNVNATYVFRSDGTVEFASVGDALPLIARQLYERYTTGAISYSAETGNLQDVVGRQWPSFEVRELKSANIFKSNDLILASSRKQAWVFTAECAMCSLPHYLARLSTAGAEGPVPIFSSRVPASVLLEVSQQAGYSGPLYIAIQEIPLLENLYAETSAFPYASDVTLSADQIITDVRQINPF